MRLPARSLLLCLCLLCGASLLQAQDVAITPQRPPTEVALDTGAKPPEPKRPDTGRVSIALISEHPGNLFTRGEKVVVYANLDNPGEAERVSMTTRIAAALGSIIYTETVGVKLPAQGKTTQAIEFEGSEHLPGGPYRIDVYVEGEKAYGYGQTLFGVWDGTATAPCPSFGISYAGPLNTDHTWQDLDLFKLAGINWLRFPLRGWLPQGNAVPPESEVYKRFIREAKDRDYSLVAAFTPTTTVDPAVNADKADAEYKESLLSATNMFTGPIAFWELARVKPDPLYPELRGIRARDLAHGREALRAFNKTLPAVFSLDSPFVGNAQEYAVTGLPQKGDILGLRYNFIGVPEEEKASPKPPLFELDKVMALYPEKKAPPVWVTEYGFDAAKGERLPNAAYQAALMARAYILARINGVERVFWRHEPGAQFDLPLTTADGAAAPGLLALRTTFKQLEGKALVGSVPAPKGMQALMFATPEVKKKKIPSRYTLVLWTVSEATGVTLHTIAPNLNITDLWGNAIELNPVDGSALCTVDMFPRFVDLGVMREVELINPFAKFEPNRAVLTPNGENRTVFSILNDPRVFSETHVVEVRFRRWPTTDEVRIEKTSWRGMYDRNEWFFSLTIPPGAKRGLVYDITTELLIGSRRVGYLTLPVWFSPDEAK
jgi:hypothetical protein